MVTWQGCAGGSGSDFSGEDVFHVDEVDELRRKRKFVRAFVATAQRVAHDEATQVRERRHGGGALEQHLAQRRTHLAVARDEETAGAVEAAVDEELEHGQRVGGEVQQSASRRHSLVVAAWRVDVSVRSQQRLDHLMLVSVDRDVERSQLLPRRRVATPATADVTSRPAARPCRSADAGLEEEFDERNVVVADGAVEGGVVVLLSAERRVGAPPQQRTTHVHATHPRTVARAHQRRLPHLVARVDVGAVAEEEGNARGQTRATRPVQRCLAEAVSAADVGAVPHEKLRHLQHIHNRSTT